MLERTFRFLGTCTRNILPETLTAVEDSALKLILPYLISKNIPLERKKNTKNQKYAKQKYHSSTLRAQISFV